MANQKKEFSDEYLKGNAMALKLLGCCFLELITERYNANKKNKYSIDEFFFDSFGECVGISGSKSTWRRWSDSRTAKIPFLANAQEFTPLAYEWAMDNGLLLDYEFDLLYAVFDLLNDPLLVKGEYSDESNYSLYLQEILEIFGGFTFCVNDDHSYFEHVVTGLEIDSATLRKIKSKTQGKLNPTEIIALKLARKLNTLSMRSSIFFDDDLTELSFSFLDFENGEIGRDALFQGKYSIKDLRNSERVRDLVCAHLVEEMKAIALRLFATCGKKQAKDKVSKLAQYVSLCSYETEKRKSDSTKVEG